MLAGKSEFELCVIDKLSGYTFPCVVDLNGYKVLKFTGAGVTYWLMLYVPGLKKMFVDTTYEPSLDGSHYVVGWIQMLQAGYDSDVRKLKLTALKTLLILDIFYHLFGLVGSFTASEEDGIWEVSIQENIPFNFIFFAALMSRSVCNLQYWHSNTLLLPT